MIGLLLAKLFQPPLGDKETLASQSTGEPELLNGSQNDSFLKSLPLIRRIADGRRPLLGESDISDITQCVALRLWKWSGNHREKSDRMSAKDWDAFAARTTYNEINRHYSSRAMSNEVSIEQAYSVSGDVLEGGAYAEVFSLIRIVWQEICNLSIRQRQALLFHSSELAVYFLQAGIKPIEMAAVLDVSLEEWTRLCERLPLSDVEIAEITQAADDPRSGRSVAKAIKKARFDARKKLERLKK